MPDDFNERVMALAQRLLPLVREIADREGVSYQTFFLLTEAMRQAAHEMLEVERGLRR